MLGVDNVFLKKCEWSHRINTLGPRQHRRRFADDIFKCMFFNENCCILIKISLKYVRKVPIDNNPALVQIMAWCRLGDKPLSESMMVKLLTHICVTRPQWVKNVSYTRTLVPGAGISGLLLFLNWSNNTGEFQSYWLVWRCRLIYNMPRGILNMY